MKIIKMFFIWLAVIYSQVCWSSEIACIKSAYRTVNDKVQAVVTNHFQYAMADGMLDTQKGLFKTAVYYKDKFIADNFMEDRKWISLTNSMKNIPPIVLNVLSKQINMLNKLIEKEWARYRIYDIIQFSAKKKALIISTTMPLTRAFKLIGSINPSVSFENAVLRKIIHLYHVKNSYLSCSGRIKYYLNIYNKS